MTQWRALSAPDIADLAVRLASLDWSWQLTDAPTLATDFGWSPGRANQYAVEFGTLLGSSTVRISGQSGVADNINVRVTDYADEDTEGRAHVRDAFADMTAAISTVLGPPTLRAPGKYAEIRWAGEQTTVRLRWFTDSVSLYLFTNSALSLEDEVSALDEQGLL